MRTYRNKYASHKLCQFLVQVVANYYGSRQRFDLLKVIHWPGGLTEAPPDIPECGFDGSGCPPDGILTSTLRVAETNTRLL